jgi:uncharacterized protein (TIGR00251 family)
VRFLTERLLAMSFRATPEGDLLVRVFAKPKASRSRVVGVQQDELVVAIAAPPVDGAANQELMRTVARALGVPKGRVKLEKGEASRHKLLRVIDFSPEAARKALGPPLG